MLFATILLSVAIHVPSWAYVGSYGYSAPPEIVQRYITYAEDTGAFGTVVEHDCPPDQFSCTPVQYIDPAIMYIPEKEGCLTGAHTTFWKEKGKRDDLLLHTNEGAHQPLTFRNMKGQYFCGGGATSYYMNVSKPEYGHWWKSYVSSHFPQHNTVIFNDDAAFNLSAHLYKVGQQASLELNSVDAQFNGEAAFERALEPRKVFANAVGPGGGYFTAKDYVLPIGRFAEKTPDNVLGYVAENPIFHPSDKTISTRNVPWLLDVAATILRASSTARFVLLDDGDAGMPVSFNDQVRRVHTALVWLSSVDDRVVDWEDVGGSARDVLNVFPEELLVPQEPLKTMERFTYGGSKDASGCGPGAGADRGGAADLLVSCGTAAYHAVGVYRREFRNCAYRGRSFGACAVILNATDQPYRVSSAWLQGRYHHSLSWTGGPLRELGCPKCDGEASLANAAFKADDTMLSPCDALFLLP